MADHVEAMYNFGILLCEGADGVEINATSCRVCLFGNECGIPKKSSSLVHLPLALDHVECQSSLPFNDIHFSRFI